MEIKDYLKVLGKRAWLLVMIPAVAGVVAGLIAVQQPQAFRTTATLQLPHDEKASPAEVAQLVADFRAAAANPTVQSQVSKDTGVTVKRIKRTKITQVGDSSQLTLGFQDKSRDATDAKAVILGLTSGSLRVPGVAAGARAGSGRWTRPTRRSPRRRTTSTRPTRTSLRIYTDVQSSSPDDDLQDRPQRASSSRRRIREGSGRGQTAAGADSYRDADRRRRTCGSSPSSAAHTQVVDPAASRPRRPRRPSPTPRPSARLPLTSSPQPLRSPTSPSPPRASRSCARPGWSRPQPRPWWPGSRSPSASSSCWTRCRSGVSGALLG